jgi:hypothetical protein
VKISALSLDRMPKRSTKSAASDPLMIDPADPILKTKLPLPPPLFEEQKWH